MQLLPFQAMVSESVVSPSAAAAAVAAAGSVILVCVNWLSYLVLSVCPSASLSLLQQELLHAATTAFSWANS